MIGQLPTWAQSQNASNVINVEISKVLTVLNLLNAGNYCQNRRISEFPSELELPRFDISFRDTNLCDGKMNFRKICNIATDSCWRRTGSDACWKPSVERFRDVSFAKNVYENLAQLFEKVTQKEPFLSTCCGQDTDCRTSFSNTKLKIIKGLTLNDQTAHYDVLQKTVRMSEGKVLGMQSVEGLERVVLHELGHACQFSQKPDIGNHFDLSYCSRRLASDPIFDSKVGATIRACTEKSHKKAAEESGGEVCLGGWMSEAFADLIFAKHIDSITVFAWTCVGDTDVRHGPSAAHMDCWLQDPKNQQLLCESKPRETK